MKNVIKCISGIGLSMLMILFFCPAVLAQHGGHGGGGHSGGGGAHSGGGTHTSATHGGASHGAAGRGGGYHGTSGFRGGLHGNYGFRGGFYRGYYGYPHIGFFIGALPFGYYPFYWGPDQYYYYGGIFYRPDSTGYVVTVPPVGAGVPKLPDGAQSIWIDEHQYYEFNGVYYKEGTDDKGNKTFVIAGKDGVLNTVDTEINKSVTVFKIGDAVPQLPVGCRKIVLNDKTYYVSPDDVYYLPFTDANNQKAYRVVSIPNAEPDGD